MKNGAELIADERKRQTEKEGWTAEHDDAHNAGELARGAAAYAIEAARQQNSQNQTLIDASEVGLWPWDMDESWKPSNYPIRNLIKAGAMLAAEIDRLQRDRLQCPSREA